MAEPYDILPRILPRPCEPIHEALLATGTERPPLSVLPDSSTSAARRPKSGIKTVGEWEVQREMIRKLYEMYDLTLEAIMITMEEEHGFQASKKQYKTKLKEWGLEKNIKDKDMRAIVRKDLKRKADDSFKATIFRLRKRPVPPQRIERYKRRHAISDETTISDAATPSDISCETPRPDRSTDHTSPARYDLSNLDSFLEPLTSPQDDSSFDSWGAFVREDLEGSSFDALTTETPSIPGPKSHARKLGLGLSPSSTQYQKDAHSSLNENCQSRTYGSWLQLLISKLQGHNLPPLLLHPNNTLTVSYLETPWDQTTKVWFPSVMYTLSDPPARILTSAGSYADSKFRFWAGWLTSRLEDIYAETIVGTQGLVSKTAQIMAFLNDIYAQDCGRPFPILAVNTSPFLTLPGLGDILCRYETALGGSHCGCDVCKTLLTILVFETFLEVFALCALGLAGMSKNDHLHWFEVIEERIKAWLRAPDAIAKLHYCYDVFGGR